MSRKKRAIEREKKQNSPMQKAKRAKKQYYASSDAKGNWEDKKACKEQSRLNKRISLGISPQCPLQSWEEPNTEKCRECKLKCSFKR